MYTSRRIFFISTLLFFACSSVSFAGDAPVPADKAQSAAAADNTRPTVRFTARQRTPTRSVRASFAFTATDTGSGLAAVECSLNQAPFVSCRSPQVFDAVANQTNFFQVRARDRAGNVARIGHRWVVDTGRPDLRITAAPPRYHNHARARFAFTASDAQTAIASLECSLNRQAYARCQSPYYLFGSPNRENNLSIRARDRAGNTVFARRSWFIDTINPELRITSRPGNSAARTATIGFEATDQGSGLQSVQCALDGGSYSVCRDSVTYNNLSPGNHRVSIRARDRAGNVTTSAHTWQVTGSSADSVPNAFNFANEAGVPIGTMRTSRPARITGINVAVSFTVSGAGEAQINNSGPWVTSGRVANNDTVRLRHRASANHNTATATTFTTLGSTRVSGTFRSTTAAEGSADATIIIDQNTGDDGYTYAQVTSDPSTYQWATLGRAVWGSTRRADLVPAEAAKAGDIVDVRAGTYDYALPYENGSLLYQPANAGARGRPIKFRARGVVRLTHSGGGILRSVIGSMYKDFIEWEGPFRIDARDFEWTGDRAPATIWGADDCVIRGTTLIGIERFGAVTENWSGVRLEEANRAIIANNDISGFVFGTNHGHGIITYDSADGIIENNHLHGGTGGIILKGQVHAYQTGFVIRNNYIHDKPDSGIYLMGASSGRIYQNILSNMRWAIVMESVHDRLGGANDPGIAGVSNFTVSNNVFYNIDPNNATGEGAVFVFRPRHDPTAYRSNLFVNNIVMNAHAMVWSWYGTTIPVSEFTGQADNYWKHNLYYNVSVLAKIADAEYSFDDWRSSLGQDNVASAPSLHGVSPAFVNGSGNYSRVSDFKLSANSPARRAGRDVLRLLGGNAGANINMGPYITPNQSDVIGRR